MQLRTANASLVLDIRLASDPEVVAEHAALLPSLADGLDLAPGATDDNDVWLARERLFASPHSTILKIACLPAKISAIAAGFALLRNHTGLDAVCVADATGIATASLSGDPQAITVVIADLRSRLREQGGSLVLLQRGTAPSTVDVWGEPPASLPLMRSLKHEFDPARILSPGRFLGGI
jgi:glycolate oxidase FAD binding subunit